jgi:hypothetical protein
MSDLKLGKKPASVDKRDLFFENYRTSAALPAHPQTFGHEELITTPWGMLGNGPDNSVVKGFQGAGDCVFAGAAHETMLWKRETGLPLAITGRNAIADYSAVTGYQLGNDATDTGTDVHQALDYRLKTGIADVTGTRHKIGAYVALDPGNLEHLLEALWLFGVVGIGFNFPDSAMDQFDAGEPWSVVQGARIDGGHYVPLVAMRANLVCVSWGKLQEMQMTFYQKYCDEAYAILSPEMLTGGKSLEGFDLAHLQSDLTALGSP